MKAKSARNRGGVRVTFGGRCEIDGMRVEVELDRLGRHVAICPGCVRRREKRCMVCRRPVRGKSWRCEDCKVVRSRDLSRRYDQRHHAERRRRERLRARTAPSDAKARRNAQKKQWRLTHPERVAAYKARQQASGTQGYATREKYLAAQQRFNDARRLKKREQMRVSAYYFQLKPRCHECGGHVEWTGRGRPRHYCGECRQVAA